MHIARGREEETVAGPRLEIDRIETCEYGRMRRRVPRSLRRCPVGGTVRPRGAQVGELRRRIESHQIRNTREPHPRNTSEASFVDLTLTTILNGAGRRRTTPHKLPEHLPCYGQRVEEDRIDHSDILVTKAQYAPRSLGSS